MRQGLGRGRGADTETEPAPGPGRGLRRGMGRNREFRKSIVDIDQAVEEFPAEIVFDPQTSGGLLMAVPAARADALLKQLHGAGVTAAAVIGEATAQHPGRIRLT